MPSTRRWKSTMCPFHNDPAFNIPQIVQWTASNTSYRTIHKSKSNTWCHLMPSICQVSSDWLPTNHKLSDYCVHKAITSQNSWELVKISSLPFWSVPPSCETAHHIYKVAKQYQDKKLDLFFFLKKGVGKGEIKLALKWGIWLTKCTKHEYNKCTSIYYGMRLMIKLLTKQLLPRSIM